MRICIDITELYKVNFVSGIQRVVIEITTRWIRDGRNVLLLVYIPEQKCFGEVDNQKYYDFYTKKTDTKDYVKTQNRIEICDLGSTDVFFDMDSVWMNPLKRSYLLPRLRQNGCRIAAHIYDIIPITDSQYCHEFTTLSFMEYIGAQIQNADLIITNAQATLNAINKLIEGTEITSIHGAVVKLGSDIRKENNNQSIREKIKEIPQKGKYILMVGTIEPRKNHQYVLKAFDEILFEKGINLVFAGRIGWNVEDLVEYINGHKELNKRLFLLNDLTDSEISFLYENTMLVAFPSYNEGFGLPIIESFNKGAVVLAADIPVLKEVGEDFCRYFSLEDINSFVNLVEDYLKRPDEYAKDKEKIKNYKNYSWDESAERMYEVLSTVF